MRKFKTIDEARAATFLEIIEEAREEIIKLNDEKFYLHAEQMKSRYFVVELMLAKIEKLFSKKEEESIEESFHRAVMIRDELDKIVPACGRLN